MAKIITRLLAASALAGAWLPAPATAQVQSTDAARTGGSADPLADIVVTARRREEALQSVPLAISAHTQDQLRELGVQSAVDLQTISPSLTVTTATAQRDVNTYSIRGQGAVFGGSAPSVQPYFSQVPIVGAGPGLFVDLQNVQVLNGPQGTLFGRNTTGGAVLYEPRRPGRELGGYAIAQIGDYDLRRLTGALNVPLAGDRVSVRLAGEIGRRDGFTRNLLNGRDLDNLHYHVLRGSIVLRPFEGFENYLVVDRYENDNNGSGNILTRTGRPATLLFPGLAASLAAQQARGVRETSFNTFTFEKRKLTTAVDIATLDLSDAVTVKNILGLFVNRTQSAFDFDASIYPIIDLPQTRALSTSNEQLSEELQLQGRSFGGVLKWVVGGYYERSKPGRYFDNERVTFGVPSTVGGEFRNTSRALFGQADLDLPWITDGLTLTGGFRYTWDRRATSSFNYNAAGQCILAGADANCRTRQSGRFSAPAWNVTLKWQITPDVLAYVANRRGYKSGGFNGLSNIGFEAFDPEYLTDFEAGTKVDWRIGDVRGRLNLAAFTSSYNDIQKQVTTNVNGIPTSIIINGAKARINGIEAEGSIVPFTGMQIGGFLSIVDAGYSRFVTGGRDISDIPFSNTPKTKYGINAAYTLPLPEKAGWITLGGNWYHQTTITFTDVNDVEPDSFERPYGLLNLRADWKNVGGMPIDAAVFVNNVTKKAYRVGVSALLASIGTSSSLYGAPRMFGVELGYHFGAR